MIFANVNKNSVQIAVNRYAVDIAVETCKLIHAIYNNLDDESGMNVTREFFRESLVAFLTSADSPLFLPIEECADAGEDGEGE